MFGSRREKFCLNNKGADQTAHLGSLVIAFVIRLLKVLYVDMPQAKFQFSSLVSVAELSGFNTDLSETLKTVFLVSQPFIFLSFYVDLFSIIQLMGTSA